MRKNIRVLIVEDSILMTTVIKDMLDSDPRITVVGTARNGKEGIEKLLLLKPDVVTLDMDMPVMDGKEFLKRVMKKHPVPVVMLSAYTKKGAAETIEALNLGAIDFVAKPSGAISVNIREVQDELRGKIVLASNAVSRESLIPAKVAPLGLKYKSTKEETKVVVICSSMGGPRALSFIFSSLPSNINACIVVIQHMAAEFTPLLANQLNRISRLHVREAKSGDYLKKGNVYIAPGGKHLEVTKEGRIVLTKKPRKHGVRPSCDIALSSMSIFGEKVLVVVLTGMGKDGSESLSVIKQQKGKIVAEDSSTAVIFGMPKAAIKTGYVDKVIPLYDIPKEIVNFTK